MLVQEPRSDGTWRTIDHVLPRRGLDQYAVDTQGNSTLRLVFLRDHIVRALRSLTVTSKETPQSLALAHATHSRLGDVSLAVGSSGGTSVIVVPGETLDLGFTPTSLAANKVRSLFLKVKGAYTTQPSSRVSGVAQVTPSNEFEFALAPARPNPSSGDVNFSFTMAKQGPVWIRIYDVAGRLVRTLINGSAEPGPHDVVWNATDDGGRRVGAGVYFCRMVVGSWVSQRKVVFLEK